jgi:hypothetical protein
MAKRMKMGMLIKCAKLMTIFVNLISIFANLNQKFATNLISIVTNLN